MAADVTPAVNGIVDGRPAPLDGLKILDFSHVFENFSSGVMRRLKLDYDAIAPDNPRVIFISLSGVPTGT